MNMEFSSKVSFKATVKLMDLSGKTVVSEVVNVTEGMNVVNVNVANLNNGMYVLVMNANGGQFSQKVIVNK